MKEKIIQKLIDLGYYIRIKDNTSLIGGIKSNDELIEGYPVLNSGFNIFINDNKALIIMANSIVVKKQEFYNVQDAIDFIKENAPLKI